MKKLLNYHLVFLLGGMALTQTQESQAPAKRGGPSAPPPPNLQQSTGTSQPATKKGPPPPGSGASPLEMLQKTVDSLQKLAQALSNLSASTIGKPSKPLPQSTVPGTAIQEKITKLEHEISSKQEQYKSMPKDTVLFGPKSQLKKQIDDLIMELNDLKNPPKPSAPVKQEAPQTQSEEVITIISVLTAIKTMKPKIDILLWFENLLKSLNDKEAKLSIIEKELDELNKELSKLQSKEPKPIDDIKSKQAEISNKQGEKSNLNITISGIKKRLAVKPKVLELTHKLSSPSQQDIEQIITQIK